MTPFGSPVLPLVNCRNATSSGFEGYGVSGRLFPEEKRIESGIDFQGTPIEALSPLKNLLSLIAWTTSMNVLFVRAYLDPETFAIKARRAVSFSQLPGLGGYVGTAIIPVAKQAKITGKKSGPGGKLRTTRSPAFSLSVVVR